MAEYPENPKIRYVIIKPRSTIVESGEIAMSDVMTLIEAYPPYAGYTIQLMQSEKDE